MSAADDHRSSADVAGEAEGARAALSHTLDQLRDNLKPAHVVEEVVSNARIGASTIADQLYQVARDHPFPALLIGLGATMIFGLGARTMSSLQPAPRPRPERTTRQRVEAERLRLSNVSALASAGSDPSLFSTNERGRVPMASSNRRSNTRRPTAVPEPSRLSGLLDEQPLIIAALGVAVGAAIGAALPQTRVENEWVGDSSTSVRRAASEAARHEIDELSDVVGRTAQNLKQAAADRGLSSDNVSGLVRDVGEHAKSAIHDVGTHASDELKTS